MYLNKKNQMKFLYVSGIKEVIYSFPVEERGIGNGCGRQGDRKSANVGVGGRERGRKGGGELYLQ